jgi:hypothetical protein
MVKMAMVDYGCLDMSVDFHFVGVCYENIKHNIVLPVKLQQISVAHANYFHAYFPLI